MLDDDEVTALASGRWVCDCLALSLQRADSNSPDCAGPGRISQLPDGTLRFTLYAIESSHLRRSTIAPGSIGDFIPDEAYYRLTARDIGGREWISDRVLPRVAAERAHPGAVWHGELHSLTSTREFTAPDLTRVKSELVCTAFHGIDGPANARTVTRIEGPGRRTEEATLDTATFSARGLSCVLEMKPSVTRLQARTRDVLPSHAEFRLLDGLRFVLATPLSWAIVQKSHRQGDSAWINGGSATKIVSSHVGPPVPFRVVSAEVKVWELLDRYLARIWELPNPEPDPISAHWLDVLRASMGGLETLALVSSVAVEAFVRELFPGFEPHADPELDACIKDLLAALEIGKWRPGLRKRFAKSFQNMKRPRVIDVLHGLAEQRAVAKKLVDSWDRLRHPVAHGRRAEDQPRRMLGLVDAVITLLYQLVFHAVGYRGLCADYTRPGWYTVYQGAGR